MIKELIKLSGLTEDEILVQVRDQHMAGRDSVLNLREDMLEDEVIFEDQRKNPELLGDTTFFNVHSALMARSYVEKSQAIFKTNERGIGAKDVVSNLNYVKNKDFNGQYMEIIKYQKDYYKFKHGVGLVAKTGWDGLNKRPVWEVVNPKNIVPDPNGDYIKKEYSYIGFEKLIYDSNIPEDWENVNDLVSYSSDSEGAGKSKQESKFNSGIQDVEQKPDKYDAQFEVYYHMATFNGIKALVITGNRDTIILNVFVFPAITKEEEDDMSLIPFPVEYDNWKPNPDSIFGHRLADFCKNAQRAKALIANLRYKKSKAELYPMYLYNSRMIKNREDLDFGFNKFVAANPLENESIQNAVAPIQRDFRADNSIIIDQSIDSQVEASTSIGKIAQGSTPDRREGVGTNQLVQGNTDINLALIGKISTWFEKGLLKLWLRGYLENFSDGDTKIAEIETGMGTINVKLTKKQFLSVYDLSIEVKSFFELEREKQAEIVNLSNAFQILQTIEMPMASKLMFARDLLRARGVSEEKVQLYVALTPNEMLAEIENVSLMEGEKVSIKPDDDDLSHIIRHKGAGDSIEAQVHVMSHVDAYISKGGTGSEISQADSQIGNMLAAQAGSQQVAEQAQLSQ